MNRMVHTKLDFSVVFDSMPLKETLLFEYGALTFSFSNLSFLIGLEVHLHILLSPTEENTVSLFPCFQNLSDCMHKGNVTTISAH